MMYIEPFDLNLRNFIIDTQEEHQIFNANTTYAIKDTFIYKNKIYKCIKQSKTSNPTNSIDFLEIKTSNSHSCIDSSIATKSVSQDKINISFDSQFGDIIFLQNCNFLYLDINISHEQNIIYQATFNMLEALDIKEYMLGERKYKKHIVIALPTTLKGTVQLALKSLGNTVSIGNIVYGRSTSLGLTLAKEPTPQFSFIDLEYFARDKDGQLQKNIREVPMSLSLGVLHTGNKTKNITTLKNLKQKMGAWLPLTNSIQKYGEINDEFAIYGALTSIDANYISSLFYDEKFTIESTT